MNNLYRESWAFYKAQSEMFTDDQEYYYDFCKNHKALELFAGYGRLTNYLANLKVDIEAIELEPEFAKFINLDKSKVHVNDVLTFSSVAQYERIIAGCNSFSLLTYEADIRRLFSLLDALLLPGGYASLNYYDINNWNNPLSTEFFINEIKIHYVTNFKYLNDKQDIGIWVDEYTFMEANEFKKIKFEYPVRIYRDSEALYPFFKDTSLELVDVIEDFGLEQEEISESGWIDYVFKKKE